MGFEEKLLVQLKRHEGYRRHPYHCTAGAVTIGYGRNLDAKGIYQEEAEFLLRNDVTSVIYDLSIIFPDWNKLPMNVRLVLADMRFNLGSGGFRQFRRMIAAVKERDWSAAARSMRESKWYGQVKGRAVYLEKLMLSGDG